MKKIMTKTLALLLAMVMLLGVVPFAAADETEVEADAWITSNKDAVWPGQSVTLTMKVSDSVSQNGVNWGNGITDKANSVSYKVPEDAVGSVTVSATALVQGKPSDPVQQIPASITLSVLEPAGEDFSITGGASAAMVGEPVNFSYTGENDSDVTWSVEGPDATISASGRFKANAEGEYIVTATAKNGGSCKAVTDKATVTVSAADYTVTMADRTANLSSGTVAMKFTVSPAATDYTAAFTSSNTAVATVDDDGVVTLKKKGETTIEVTVTIDGKQYRDDALLTVVDKGTITCAQDGKETSSSSTEMVFKLNGVDSSQNVKWNISVSGEGDFDITDKEESGTTASITVEADSIGVAKVDVTATWGDDGEASETFCVSFYQTINVKAELKDGVEKFDFDKTGIFQKVSNASNPDKKSMYSFLTDGVASRVILSETSSMNERVGKITCANASSFAQYDPDDENDYSIAGLEDMTFRVVGQGTYKLDYELYAMVSGTGYATTKGTIQIVAGGATSDIEYTTMMGGSVKFDEDDFVDFWEDNGEDDEDLKYVTFSVATSSNMMGSLFTNNDKDVVKSTWKFYPDYDKKNNTYDLNDVTYHAPSASSAYEDTITFVCYGDDGSEVPGVVTVSVANGKMSFTDVATTDWFYDEVLYVYARGIMNGTDSKTFSPNATLNRAMVVTMLYRIEGSPVTAVNGTFSDVPSGQWYSEAVEWAAKNEIVNGVGNGKFAPTTAITREQLATILYRYTTEYKGESVNSGSLSSFSDADKVTDFAKSAMQWAVGTGIITGDNGKLMPQGNATRAQAAAMFSRFMQLDSSTGSRYEDDETVYVYGTKYHYDEDCAGKNAKERDLEDVEDDYKPCSKCVDNDDETVYIVTGSSKYHYDEDCAGKNAREKDLEDVEDDYDPCSKCVD